MKQSVPHAIRWMVGAGMIVAVSGSTFADDTVLPADLEKWEAHVMAGPWGRLEFFPILLEPTDLLVSNSRYMESWKEGTVWKFATPNREAVVTLLLGVGLKEETARGLAAPGSMEKNEESGFFELRPPDEVIEALSSEQREKLYRILQPVDDVKNEFFNPFSFPGKETSSLLRDTTGVPPSQVNLIEKLSYKRGEATFFSDVHYVLGKAADYDERFHILKTVFRERSLYVRLRIPSKNDFPSISEFWSSSGRNPNVIPLLDSLKERPVVDFVDIVHLLPPSPRKLLHTYPNREGELLPHTFPDCFWTAFSFFEEDPSYRLFDTVDHVFNERYEQVSQPLQFGDTITIWSGTKNRTVHACNYIAGDLVFTKNGVSLGRPWVISTINDVARRYLTGDPIKISFYRLKPEYLR